jgi:hypothetical protein
VGAVSALVRRVGKRVGVGRERHGSLCQGRIAFCRAVCAAELYLLRMMPMDGAAVPVS